MTAPGWSESPPGNQEAVGLLVASAVTGVTLAVAFSLLALGVEDFWVVFVVGFGFVLPTSLGVVGHRWEKSEEESGGDDAETPLDELRLRYARGELTETEFERRLEVLLEEADERERL